MSSSSLEAYRTRILQIAFALLIVLLIYSVFLGNLFVGMLIVAKIIVIVVALWLLYRIAVGVERIARASERIATVRERGLRNGIDREDL